MKKFSSMKQTTYKLIITDDDGDTLYLDHIDNDNIKDVEKITLNKEMSKEQKSYELIKILVHGDDFSCDLEWESDKEKIIEIISYPNDILAKIIIEIYKMILQRSNEKYETMNSLKELSPKLKKEIGKVINDNYKKNKQNEYNKMSKEELIKLIEKKK